MTTLTKATFKSTIANGVTLVDFWADWCGYCRMLEPILDEFQGMYEGKVKVGKVNIDSEEDLTDRYEVTTLPTIIIFKDGKEIDRRIGMQPLESLEEMIAGEI